MELPTATHVGKEEEDQPKTQRTQDSSLEEVAQTATIIPTLLTTTIPTLLTTTIPTLLITTIPTLLTTTIPTLLTTTTLAATAATTITTMEVDADAHPFHGPTTMGM